MASEKPSEISQMAWDRHKSTIRRLYLEQHMSLRSVMQYMAAQFPELAGASENMYKKRIHRWGFDVKNHKFSTIETAASLHQQCLKRGVESERYEQTGRKPVSKEELDRYARRKRRKIINGKLVPRSPVPAAATPNVATYDDVSARPVTLPLLQQAVKQRQTLALPSFQEAQESATTAGTSTIPRCRPCCCRAPAADTQLNYPRFVRPIEIEAPHMHRDPEMFFSTYRFCLESSWSAGLWSVTEKSVFIYAQRRRGGLNCFAFDDLFIRAAELLERCDIRRASKVFDNAVLALRDCLEICIPKAMYNLFVVMTELLLRREKREYVSLMVRRCLEVVNQGDQAHSVLKKLFSALCAIDPDALVHAILQGWEVYSNSMESLHRRLYLHAMDARSYRITSDPSLDWGCKAARLNSLLVEVRQRPTRDIRAEVSRMEDLAWAYYRCGEDWMARDIAENLLRLAEPYIDQSNYFRAASADALRVIAGIYWETSANVTAGVRLYNTRKALEALGRAIGLRKKFHLSGTIRNLKLLAHWQKTLGNGKEARACYDEVERLTNTMAAPDFRPQNRDPMDRRAPGADEGPSHTCMGGNCCGKCTESEPGRNAGIGGARGTHASPAIWRERLTPAQQTELTLPVPDPDGDFEMQDG